MKQKNELTGTAVKLLAVAAIVCAAAIDAHATNDRFHGGSFDGYNQCEAKWTTQFTIWSRFFGGSFDGYDAITKQMAMLLSPPKGTIFSIH